MASVAVIGGDGRRIAMLHEDDARTLARTIHASTGEKVSLVWPDDPRADEVLGADSVEGPAAEEDPKPKPKARKKAS